MPMECTHCRHCRRCHSIVEGGSIFFICMYTLFAHEIYLPPLGEDVPMKSLAELDNTEGELCCVVGTMFRKMELQPSILKEISAKVSKISTELILLILPLM